MEVDIQLHPLTVGNLNDNRRRDDDNLSSVGNPSLCQFVVVTLVLFPDSFVDVGKLPLTQDS